MIGLGASIASLMPLEPLIFSPERDEDALAINGVALSKHSDLL